MLTQICSQKSKLCFDKIFKMVFIKKLIFFFWLYQIFYIPDLFVYLSMVNCSSFKLIKEKKLNVEEIFNNRITNRCVKNNENYLEVFSFSECFEK